MTPPLKSLSHTGLCLTGFKSQSLLTQQVLSIRLCFHSHVHSDAQCHPKARNWIQNKIDMINCYLFCLEIVSVWKSIQEPEQFITIWEKWVPLRGNIRAFMWCRKKVNTMGVRVGKREVGLWSGEISHKVQKMNKDYSVREEVENAEVSTCSGSWSLRRKDDVQRFIRLWQAQWKITFPVWGRLRWIQCSRRCLNWVIRGCWQRH